MCLSQPGSVLSVDLASRSYTDNGIAYLPTNTDEVQVVHPRVLGLDGTPSPDDFASALDTFSQRESVSVILLDGPQGWRLPGSMIQHMRLCERVLNTPGRTGELGSVKPKTLQSFVQFSINLFSQLHFRYGWQLLIQDWHHYPATRWVVESFPSSAWKTLGLSKLPAKRKVNSHLMAAWREDLRMATGLKLPVKLTHDELQAAVCLPAGRAIASGRKEGIVLSGFDPIVTGDAVVLEGWIVNPCLIDN